MKNQKGSANLLLLLVLAGAIVAGSFWLAETTDLIPDAADTGSHSSTLSLGFGREAIDIEDLDFEPTDSSMVAHVVSNCIAVSSGEMPTVVVDVTHDEEFVLILCSKRRARWLINPTAESRIVAVAVCCEQPQIVEGLENHCPIVTNATADGHYAPVACTRIGDTFESFQKWAKAYCGREIATFQQVQHESDSVVTIGKQSPLWRQQMSEFQTKAERLEQERQATLAFQKAELSRLADIRFRAIRFLKTGDLSRGTLTTSAQLAEFTPVGPDVRSLKPLDVTSIRHLKQAGENGPWFALDHQAELYKSDDSGRLLDPVALPFNLSGYHEELDRFNVLVWDSKRERLVIGSRGPKPILFAINPQSFEWEVLGNPGWFLAALAYDPGEDVLYGVSSIHRHGRRPARCELIKMTPSGALIEEISPQFDIDTSWHEQFGVQLFIERDLATVITTPRRQTDGTFTQHIYMFDKETGHSIHHAVASPQGLPQSKTLTSPRRPLFSGLTVDGQLDELIEKRHRLHQAIAATGNTETRSKLETISADVDAILRGLPESDASQPELHLVGIHVANGTVVRVTDTSRPIMLSLSSYNLSTWRLEVDEDVDLRRLIVGGYHVQKVLGIPADTAVEYFVHDNGQNSFYAYPGKSGSQRAAYSLLKKATGLSVATFQGGYKYEGQPVIVGPESGEWRLGRALFHLNQLASR